MTSLDVSGILMHWTKCDATRFSQCLTRSCQKAAYIQWQSGQVKRVVCGLEGNVWVSGTEVQWWEDFNGDMNAGKNIEA